MKNKHSVHLSYENAPDVTFKPKATIIKREIQFLLKILCTFSSEVSIRFCGLAEMQKTNLYFRKKNKPTDVLSFLPDLSTQENAHYLGDILICVPVCLKQANNAKHSLSKEIRKMIIHALVHLKGFDHERSDADARVMSTLEQSLDNEVKKNFGNEPRY